MCHFVSFCLVAVVSICFYSSIYRRGVWYGACSCFYFIFILFLFFRQLTPRDASPGCLFTSFFYSIWFLSPFSSTFIFISLCVAHSLSLSLYSYLGCLALLIWLPFFHSLLRRFFILPTRIICRCPLFILLLFVFCFLVFPPEEEPFPGDDVLCRLLSRPLPCVCFLPCLFVLFRFSPTVFVPGWFWCNFLYLVTTAGFVADQLIM